MVIRFISNIITIDIQIEKTLGHFSEDYAKMFLDYVHKAHGNNKNRGRGKIIRSIKNGGRPNYRGIS